MARSLNDARIMVGTLRQPCPVSIAYGAGLRISAFRKELDLRIRKE